MQIKSSDFDAGESRAIVVTEIHAMGGAERALLGLSRWLHQQKLPHHFVTYSDRLGLASRADHPLTVVELCPRMDPIHKVTALRRHLRASRSAYKPLMSGYQPVLHATLAGAKGFHTLMHDTPSLLSDALAPAGSLRSLRKSVANSVVGYGLRSGGKVMVASEYLRQETMQVFGEAAELVPLGAHSITSRFEPRRWEGSLHMISVSRLEANKRLDWIIRALALMERAPEPLSTRVDWRFDIIGEGPRGPYLQKLVAEFGLTDRIHLHGFVSDHQLQSRLAAANLMVMPARQGYGLPAIEALQSGIPVLIHRESGVSDLLLATPWAFVFEGGEDALVRALDRALTSMRQERHVAASLPLIPTEDQWAARVAELCNWL